MTAPIDYTALASSQDQDAELKDISQNGSALLLEPVHIPETDVSNYCDTSTPQMRPFITMPFRRQDFDTLHSLSHPGDNATVKLVSQRVCGRKCVKTVAHGHARVHLANCPR